MKKYPRSLKKKIRIIVVISKTIINTIITRNVIMKEKVIISKKNIYILLFM
jgi:hypothetical protein